MRAVTLGQPYAQAVAAGLKRVETRPDWARRLMRLEGETLAIHAGAPGSKFGPDHPIWRTAAPDGRVIDALRPLDFGAVLAVCTIGVTLPTSNVNVTDEVESGTTYRTIGWGPLYLAIDENEHAWGDYSLGRYATQLPDVVRLPVPVAARGAQQLWNLKPETEDAVLAQVEQARRG